MQMYTNLAPKSTQHTHTHTPRQLKYIHIVSHSSFLFIIYIITYNHLDIKKIVL